MSEQKVQKLAQKAKDSNIFVCGHASNDIDLLQHFSKVFCLLLSEEETRVRLSSRTNNSWGNDPEQLAMLMKWHKPTLDRYKLINATMIDASQPIEEVVDEILALTKA